MRGYARIVAGVGAGLILLCACEQPLHQRQASMPPDLAETLPEWAFDAPYYFRPSPDAVPREASQPNADLPQHYYVRERVFMIERPNNDVPASRVPRVAVWWTNTNGGQWTRAGYFGLGQTHFPFVGGDDGDYAIRFVGPGIKESLTEETIPHRIYHLDTVPPCVKVVVEPDHPIYESNELVWVHWAVDDPNLDKKSVRLAICWSWENPDLMEYRLSPNYPPNTPEEMEKAASRFWKPFKPAFDTDSVLAYTIPEYAAGEAFQFQVRAKDRAGNYGVGYSKVIMVSGTKGSGDGLFESPASTTQPATPFVESTAKTNETLFK